MYGVLRKEVLFGWMAEWREPILVRKEVGGR